MEYTLSLTTTGTFKEFIILEVLSGSKPKMTSMELSHASQFKETLYMQVLRKVRTSILNTIGSVIVFNLLNGTFVK